MRMSIIYSPAPKHGNASDCNIFLDEFAGMLEHELLLSVGKLMILGDFNYHLDDLTDNNVRKFNNLLHACGLVQHVTVPTHVKGHILDAVITRDGEIDVVNIQTNLCIESDHYTVLFDIDVPCTGITLKIINCRKWKDFDLNKFKMDLAKNIAVVLGTDNIDQAVARYNKVLIELVDLHAPAKPCKVRVKAGAPWYNGDIHHAKQVRRKLERRWRRTRLNDVFTRFKRQRTLVNNLIRKVKVHITV